MHLLILSIAILKSDNQKKYIVVYCQLRYGNLYRGGVILNLAGKCTYKSSEALKQNLERLRMPNLQI